MDNATPSVKRQLTKLQYKLIRRNPRLSIGFNLNRKKLILISLLAAILIIGLSVGLYFAFREEEKSWKRASIVTNGMECAAIGMDILKRDGSAADATLAALFCEGISCPQSMGLGGGFLLTIYTKETGKVETLNAREKAPLAADENMFVDEPEGASVEGGLAIAVPGELKGYWELHQKYGKLPWATLIEPAIKLCREGHTVTNYLASILGPRNDKIYGIPSLREVFINPATNRTWKAGDKIKRLKLAETLEIIAKEGVDAIYNGSLTDSLVKDIQDFGGIITKEDLLIYKPRWEEPTTATFLNEETLYTSPLPGSGPILTFILNILDKYVLDKTTALTWHRIVESFKFAFAKRTDLGDPKYVTSIQELIANLTNPDYADYIRSQINDDLTYNDYAHYGANFSNVEDHGTAHISILAPNGDAVSVTSTVNYILGSMRRSQSTGIILNDEMDDFSIPNVTNAYGIPASPANYIYPQKIPMSSMCPSILVDKNGDVQLIIGGAGGSKITTSVAYTIIRHLWFGESLLDVIHAKRIHHQLAPMEVQFEQGFNTAVLANLTNRGHVLHEFTPDLGFAALIAISKKNDKISAIFDPRRGGTAITESWQ